MISAFEVEKPSKVRDDLSVYFENCIFLRPASSADAGDGSVTKCPAVSGWFISAGRLESRTAHCSAGSLAALPGPAGHSRLPAGQSAARQTNNKRKSVTASSDREFFRLTDGPDRPKLVSTSDTHYQGINPNFQYSSNASWRADGGLEMRGKFTRSVLPALPDPAFISGAHYSDRFPRNPALTAPTVSLVVHTQRER